MTFIHLQEICFHKKLRKENLSFFLFFSSSLCHNLNILSDSHGLKEPLNYIRNTYPNADCIIHCGDICLPKEYAKGFIIVAGNCDNPAWYPNGEIIQLEGHRILILHGHILFSSSSPNLDAVARCAKRNDCDIAFFGHSHIYCDTMIQGIHVCNPGSISMSRDGSNPSFMKVHLTQDSFQAERIDYTPYR